MAQGAAPGQHGTEPQRPKVVSLCPRKQTCALQQPMSALGQKRTSRNSFDHLIRAGKHRRRDGKVERAGRFEIDHQIVFVWRLHR